MLTVTDCFLKIHSFHCTTWRIGTSRTLSACWYNRSTENRYPSS